MRTLLALAIVGCALTAAATQPVRLGISASSTNGSYTVNGRHVNTNELIRILTRLSDLSKTEPIFITLQDDAPVGAVLDLAEMTHSVGLTNLYIFLDRSSGAIRDVSWFKLWHDGPVNQLEDEGKPNKSLHGTGKTLGRFPVP